MIEELLIRLIDQRIEAKLASAGNGSEILRGRSNPRGWTTRRWNAFLKARIPTHWIEGDSNRSREYCCFAKDLAQALLQPKPLLAKADVAPRSPDNDGDEELLRAHNVRLTRSA